MIIIYFYTDNYTNDRVIIKQYYLSYIKNLE